jgi:hypothetical protein
METVKQPTKQQLREYLYSRHQAKEPPPTPEDIRRELGWHMIPQTPR